MKKSLLESRDVARDPRIDPNAFFIEIDKIGCRKLDRNDVTRRIVIHGENSRGSIRSYGPGFACFHLFRAIFVRIDFDRCFFHNFPLTFRLLDAYSIETPIRTAVTLFEVINRL